MLAKKFIDDQVPDVFSLFSMYLPVTRVQSDPVYHSNSHNAKQEPLDAVASLRSNSRSSTARALRAVGLTSGLLLTAACAPTAAEKFQHDIARDGKQETVVGYYLEFLAHGKLDDLPFIEQILNPTEKNVSSSDPNEREWRSTAYAYRFTLDKIRRTDYIVVSIRPVVRDNTRMKEVQIFSPGRISADDMKWLRAELKDITVEDFGDLTVPDGGGPAHEIRMRLDQETPATFSLTWVDQGVEGVIDLRLVETSVSSQSLSK